MTGFLETVMAEYNRMRSRAFAGGYEGVTHAGIAIVASDTGLVFFTQRAPDPTDAPDVAETWEFPGGGLNPSEEPFPGAVRELLEETYLPLPAGMVVNGWRSANGVYQGFVYLIETAFSTEGWTPTEECQAVGWFTPQQIMDSGKMRPELADTPWPLLDATSYSQEADQMDDKAAAYSAIFAAPIPVHGVVAPEGVETGDKRAFKDGAVTRRPLRLPLSWQKTSLEGHTGSVVTGSMDRLMRKDGLIHWEGALMPSDATEEFIDLLAFFNKYGVSVDGDKGNLDTEQTLSTGVLWFDAVRASGLTAVSIPAFSEAYVAFGLHPDMPDDESADVLTSSGYMVGGRMEFGRGPGWVTDPVDTNRIHDYWTKPGQEGYAKVGWGTPGDFARAKSLIGQEIAEHSPDKMRFLNQIIAQWHFDALGYWPATHAKMDRAGLKKPAPVAAHATGTVEASADEEPWEAVLTSSASGRRAYPPKDYFSRHPDTNGPCVIEEPDANGLRRTFGYAAEWGVCHIGKDGVCVEVPEDMTGGYLDFHKGRTKVDGGDYVKTGLITYGVQHRDAETILSQTPTQAHFDDLSHAWAAVRVGEDERGVWFSGVVLPTVEEKWLTAIEASGQVSGEWLYGAMRTLLTVNVAGFPVEDSSAVYNDNGEVVALAASAFGTWKCGESPADRMEALRMIDAEERFAALKREFLAQRIA